MTTEFWPAAIQDSSGMVPPIAILKEAAEDLAEKTQNVVHGEVETIANPLRGKFEHVFFVVAPALDDYKYELLRVTHDVDLYPAWIYLREYVSEMKATLKSGEEFPDAESLREGLAAAFSRPKIQKAVKSLLAQSHAA